MIYTVTLSPSIDYIVRMSNMRSFTTNRTDSEELYFGGRALTYLRCWLSWIWTAPRSDL